jgi:hypothetical protein
MLPEPIIECVGPIYVLRDDLLPGGTKRRVLGQFLHGADEYVYASPAYGYAQVALAHTCRELGKRATIFVAKRGSLHPRTAEAKRAGAKIVQIPYGYLSNVQAKARAYADIAGATLLPFGLDFAEFRDALAGLAAALPIQPAEVWTVAGSGTLSRALQQAWPQAAFHAVRVGAEPNVGRATLHVAGEKFEEDARLRPPFPSCSNYDAKAWQFVSRYASAGALFWNVAA